jgi:hypothetical protein
VTFQQRLFLTSEQEAHLRTVWRLVQDLDRIVTLVHRHHSVGQTVTLAAVAASVLDGADTLPDLPPLDTPARDPLIPIRPFMQAFRALARSRGWERLAPLQTFEEVVRDRCRWARKWTWRRATLRYTPDSPLTERLDLPVGGKVQHLDPVTVQLALFGEHPNVLVDAVRLPPRFQAAFEVERRRYAAILARSLAGAQEADQEGAEWGRARITELTTRFPALRGDRQAQDPVLETGQPKLLNTARVRQVSGVDGNLHHVIEWRFDVRGCPFAPWVFDDALGVDVGERYLFTAVSGSGQHLKKSAAYATPAVPPLTADPWGLGQWDAVHGTPLTPVMTGKQEALKREVRWRHLTFVQLQPQFGALLDLCLLHRHVGLESLDLAAMRRKNWSFPAFLERSGFAEVLGWVETLAPLHGVTVHHVEARRSSRTCSRCGLKGDRPREDKVFRCRGCGHTEQSDLNAARVIRQRTLSQVGEAQP